MKEHITMRLQLALNVADLDEAVGALDALAAGEQGLLLLDTDEVKTMGRIQRGDVKDAALHQLARAVGHVEDVLERRGHFKTRHGRRDGEE